MKKFCVVFLLAATLLTLSIDVKAATYYLSPSGGDGNPGTESQPWTTFARAWKTVVAGDTLILLDGVYFDKIEPPFGGQQGKPITIKAKNDGGAVIDGESLRTPVLLRNYKNAHYLIIEGIVARNGPVPPLPQSVIYIETDYNILRRVSAYNAHTDENTSVIGLAPSAEYNLIEDCVAAGTGRKMLNLYKSPNNTVRRCLAFWLGWDGRNSCQDWPNGGNIHVYDASYNTVENCIAIGPMGKWSILVQANSDNSIAKDNKVLGSIAIHAGMNPDGTPIAWPKFRPLPTECDPYKVVDFKWLHHRVGFTLYGSGLGQMTNNVFRDILSTANAGVGFSLVATSNTSGNLIDRATIAGNGIDAPSADGGIGTDARYEEISKITVNNSIIPVIRDSRGKSYPGYTGEGARLRHRYVDGKLMDGTNGQVAQPLWPWPMEERIRRELGISVTNMVADLVPDQVKPIAATTLPHLQVAPLFGTFGDVEVNKTVTRDVTLKNTTSNAFTVVTAGFQGLSSAFKTATGGTCPSFPFTLSASSSCTVRVAFSPKFTQPESDYLSFHLSDPSPYPFAPRVYVSGIGKSSGTVSPTAPPSAPTGVRIDSIQN